MFKMFCLLVGFSVSAQAALTAAQKAQVVQFLGSLDDQKAGISLFFQHQSHSQDASTAQQIATFLSSLGCQQDFQFGQDTSTLGLKNCGVQYSRSYFSDNNGSDPGNSSGNTQTEFTVPSSVHAYPGDLIGVDGSSQSQSQMSSGSCLNTGQGDNQSSGQAQFSSVAAGTVSVVWKSQEQFQCSQQGTAINHVGTYSADMTFADFETSLTCNYQTQENDPVGAPPKVTSTVSCQLDGENISATPNLPL